MTINATTRKVPIDWDDLEMALTMNMEEHGCYLDLRTGRVEMTADPDLVGDVAPSEEEVDKGLAEGYFVHIEPLGSSVEYGWMADFADTVTDPSLRDKLAVALDGRGAFRRFKNVLADYPAERDRWFTFRAAHLCEAMDEWLADNDIEPTTARPESR